MPYVKVPKGPKKIRVSLNIFQYQLEWMRGEKLNQSECMRMLLDREMKKTDEPAQPKVDL